MKIFIASMLALAAALLYGLSNAIEHREVIAVDEPEGGVHFSLLARLVRRPWWLFGMACDVGAFVLYAIAIGVGGIVVAAPILPLNLLFALPLSARWSGRRIGRDEIGAALLLCVGISLFLYEAAPAAGASTASLHTWFVPLTVASLVVVGALILAGGLSGAPRATVIGGAAGVCNGMMSAFTRTFVHLVPLGAIAVLTHWESYGLAVSAITSLVLIQSMFQGADLSAGLPMNETVEPLIATFLGIRIFGESISGATPAENAVIAIAIVMMIVAVIRLSSSAKRHPLGTHPSLT